MIAFIDPPARIPFWLKIGISISERITGKIMLPARILAWYPRAAVGSGVLGISGCARRRPDGQTHAQAYSHDRIFCRCLSLLH